MAEEDRELDVTAMGPPSALTIIANSTARLRAFSLMASPVRRQVPTMRPTRFASGCRRKQASNLLRPAEHIG